jgi:hypothetical protein
MKTTPLDVSDLLYIDKQGYTTAPNIYQLQDKDVRTLYERDKDSNKLNYIKEVGVVYYLADPKSPANQLGYNLKEALAMAKTNYDLDKEWQPDGLIYRLIDKYRKGKVGVAGEVMDSALKAIHNSSLALNKLNELVSDKLSAGLTIEETITVVEMVTKINTIVDLIPKQIKALNEAKQNLEYEVEQKKARGGITITTSMMTDDSEEIAALAEAEKKRLNIHNPDNQTSINDKRVEWEAIE